MLLNCIDNAAFQQVRQDERDDDHPSISNNSGDDGSGWNLFYSDLGIPFVTCMERRGNDSRHDTGIKKTASNSLC